jgi:hypothetical protein
VATNVEYINLLQGDVMDSTSCPHCLQCPCITRHAHSWLRGAAAPSVTNRTKRYSLSRKSLRTTPYDPREVMLYCNSRKFEGVIQTPQACHIKIMFLLKLNFPFSKVMAASRKYFDDIFDINHYSFTYTTFSTL